jgi:Alkylmercury lyase
MTERELALRHAIMTAFARTGAPPEHPGGATLARLAEQHVVVLDDAGRIRMAHPFAAAPGGARVDAGGARWWGNCAWDGLGIVAALGLRDADVSSGQIVLRVRAGRLLDDALFHVALPARAWWDDIAYT